MKSPECSADRGRSIARPAWRSSISIAAEDLGNSLMSAAGKRDEELLGLVIDGRGDVVLSYS